MLFRSHMCYQRFCHTIGNQIADGDIDDKLDHNFPAALFVLEGKILIQEIADNAADHIIHGGGEPIATMKCIVA